MADIVKFYPANAAQSADNVLEQAVGVYDDVVIIGIDKSGALDVRATTAVTEPQMLWMVEAFKHRMLSSQWAMEE